MSATRHDLYQHLREWLGVYPPIEVINCGTDAIGFGAYLVFLDTVMSENDLRSVRHRVREFISDFDTFAIVTLDDLMNTPKNRASIESVFRLGGWDALAPFIESLQV